MAGFYPAWKASVTRTWLNDDPFRYLIEEDQREIYSYEEEEPNDEQVREKYLSIIRSTSPEMYFYNRKGVELRALYAHLQHVLAGNAKAWMIQYATTLWDSDLHGRFPFDIDAWRGWHIDVSSC